MVRRLFRPGILTPIVLGLFGARLVAELSGNFYNLPVLLGLAAVGFLVAYVVCRIRQWPTSTPWWLIIPLVYIVWPDYAPEVGLILLALVSLILVMRVSLPELLISDWEILIFLAALLAYFLTLSPGVVPADGGEFQTTSTILGIAHPPGYPLYTMLGYLATLVPLGTPAWRINLLSAVEAAATLAIVSASIRRLHPNGLWGSLAAVVTLGALPIFWSVATAASVRPLTALFAALLAYEILSFSYSRRRGNRSERRDRHLIRFAFFLALGLGHHASLVFIGACGGITAMFIDRTLIQPPRRWLRPAIAFVVGLLPLLYLPIRSAAGAPGGAGDLTTLQGFFHHISAQGFGDHIFQFTTLDDFVTRVQVILDILRYQFNDILLIAALVGAVTLFWQSKRLAVLLIGGLLLHTFATATFRSPQISEYMIPAYVLLAMLIGYAVNTLIEAVRIDLASLLGRTLLRAGYLAAGLALLAAVAIAAKTLPNALWVAGQNDTQDYVHSLLKDAPADSIILANWHWYTALDYAVTIEKQRQNVDVRYVYPEGTDAPAVTWVKRMDSAITEGRPVLVTETYQTEYAASPYSFEPVGQALLVRQTPRRDPPSDLTTLNKPFGPWTLLGYRQNTPGIEVGSDFTVDIAWQVAQTPTQDMGFFASLLSDDGTPFSQFDLRHPAARVQTGDIVFDRYPLSVPPGIPAGNYKLVAGVYTINADGKTERLKTQDGADSVTLTTLAILPSSWPQVTRNPYSAAFLDGPVLVGVDHDFSINGVQRVFLHWQGQTKQSYTVQLLQGGNVVGSAVLPAAADSQTTIISVPPGTEPLGLRVLAENGQPLTHRTAWGISLNSLLWIPGAHFDDRYVPFGGGITLVGIDPSTNLQVNPVRYNLLFYARRPLLRDFTLSLRLIAPAWSTVQEDSPPSLGAFPTIKWIQGPLTMDRHLMSVPPKSAEGPIQSQLVIYDSFTQQALSILDPRLTAQGPLLSLSGTPGG